MVHLFSQPCCFVRQRQIPHRTHCPHDLAEGEKQDQAEQAHPHFGYGPAFHSPPSLPQFQETRQARKLAHVSAYQM